MDPIPSKKRLKKSPTSPVLKGLYILAVVVSAIIVLTYICFKAFIKPPPMVEVPSIETQSASGLSQNAQNTKVPSNSDALGNYERKPYCYTFLLVASDQVGSNADTIMVLTYDTVEQTAGLVSIPRDTLVGHTFPKINAIYYNGVEALRDEVSKMLGIPIDYYICVDIDGFVKIVDTVGEIDFDVPIHMSYDDPLQDLNIHFEPGMQYIDGKDALAICRLRQNSDGTTAYPDSDIGRTRTQQELLIAIAKKLIQNPQKALEYVEIWNQYVDTNLKTEYIVWFATSLLDFPLDKGISFETLPGDGTVKYNSIKWCYELYPDEVLDIVNRLLNPYTEPLTEENLDIFQVK